MLYTFKEERSRDRILALQRVVHEEIVKRLHALPKTELAAVIEAKAGREIDPPRAGSSNLVSSVTLALGVGNAAAATVLLSLHPNPSKLLLCPEASGEVRRGFAPIDAAARYVAIGAAKHTEVMRGSSVWEVATRQLPSGSASVLEAVEELSPGSAAAALVSRAVNSERPVDSRRSSDQIACICNATAYDEAAGLVLQCDRCMAWSHWACTPLLPDDPASFPKTFLCQLCAVVANQPSRGAYGDSRRIDFPVMVTAKEHPDDDFTVHSQRIIADLSSGLETVPVKVCLKGAPAEDVQRLHGWEYSSGVVASFEAHDELPQCARKRGTTCRFQDPPIQVIPLNDETSAAASVVGRSLISERSNLESSFRALLEKLSCDFPPISGSLTPQDAARYLLELEYIIKKRSVVLHERWDGSQWGSSRNVVGWCEVNQTLEVGVEVHGFKDACDDDTEQDARNCKSHFLFAHFTGKRRVRCGKCAGCVKEDCGECKACKDKPKFGGSGTMKQSCEKKKCSAFRLTEPIRKPGSAAARRAEQQPLKPRVPLVEADKIEKNQKSSATVHCVSASYGDGDSSKSSTES